MAVYSIDEIQKLIEPIAIEYQLASVYLFGSYARGEATEESDIDILIDPSDSKVKSILNLGGLYEHFISSLNKQIDIIDLCDIFVDINSLSVTQKEKILNERLLIYER